MLIPSYTICISEAQRAMLQELLEKNEQIVRTHQSAATGIERENLDWNILCDMFRALPEHEAKCKAEHPDRTMTFGFCL